MSVFIENKNPTNKIVKKVIIIEEMIFFIMISPWFLQIFAVCRVLRSASIAYTTAK
jgi:hypothetical protein